MACAQEVVTWKGQLFFEDKPEPEPPALPGSLVAFSLNGSLQGIAYRRAPHWLSICRSPTQRVCFPASRSASTETIPTVRSVCPCHNIFNFMILWTVQ